MQDLRNFVVPVKSYFAIYIKVVLELMLSTQLLLVMRRKINFGALVLSTSRIRKVCSKLFYYVRKVYCIRGEEEQRCLKPSQFVRSCQPDCYTYTEHGSKNRSGGLAELHVENKQVPCYANPGNAPRCTLLRKTFFIFNLKRCSLLTTHSDCWYDCVPVGKNKLSTMVRDICTAGGITKKTNHSLRATGATALFKAGVPEKIIQSTTGHRSVDALQCYERVSDEQQQATSRVLTARDPNVRVNAEMSRVKVQQTTCTCKYACKYAESSQSLPLASVFGQLHVFK